MMKKALKLDLKYFDEDGEGTFEGYGSTFDNMDRVGDVVEKGAFERTLAQHRKNGTMPAMLLHHDMTRPVGKWTHMEEDSKGLYVKGKLSLGVRDADEAHKLLRDGVIDSMSIGYIVNKEVYDYQSSKNHLHEISLHEVSLVTIPANAQAMVSAVKSAEGDLDIRSLEAVLREAGLSRREAKALLAGGFKAVDPEQDIVKALADEYIQECVSTELTKQVRLHQLASKLKDF